MRNRRPPHSTATPLPGHEILDRGDAPARPLGTDLDIAKVEPELARLRFPVSAIATATALSRATDSLTKPITWSSSTCANRKLQVCSSAGLARRLCS